MGNLCMFWMALLAPIANVIVDGVLWLINRNTFKVNLAIGLGSLCLFAASWLYTANNAASSTPAWIATAVLFWIGWHRLQEAWEIRKGRGQAVIPGPDFFKGCATVKVLSCEQFWDNAYPQPNPDHETLQLSCEVFEDHHVYALLICVNNDYTAIEQLRIIQYDRPLVAGYYKPMWQNGRWEFLSVRTHTTH